MELDRVDKSPVREDSDQNRWVGEGKGEEEEKQDMDE